MKTLLTLFISLFALGAQAQTTFEHFTMDDEWPVFGEYPDIQPNILDPGEFFCTGGGEPVGMFECLGGNGIHIRGTQMMSCATNVSPDDDGRLQGTIWFDFNANWDASYSGPVSGNWRIVPGPACDWLALIEPDNFWEGTYTGKRELVPGSYPATWVTSLKLRGYGVGELLAGQKIKATEVITTFSPLPVPWEMLPPELQAYTGTGPEGKAEVTIKTVE